jgi:hypothetical protein
MILLLGRATDVAGSTDRLRDTVRLQSNAWASSAFDDCYVRASGGNVDGEVVRVDYLNTANGDLYVTPDWSLAPDIDTSYEIFRPGVDPDDVDRARDRALTDICSQWYLHPVSSVPNAAYIDNSSVAITASSQASPTVITTAAQEFITGDRVRITGHIGSVPDINGVHTIIAVNSTTFTIPVDLSDAGDNGTGGTAENLDMPSNWTLANSTVITRGTLGFPMELSRYGLLVTNGGTLEGQARSDPIYVQPSERFFLHVPVSVRSGIAEVIVYDVSNSGEISLTGTATATLRGWTGITVTGTTPSGCGEIMVYLSGQEVDAVVEWGPVYFHWQNQRRIDLPARVLSREWIGPVGMILDQLGQGDRGQESLREVPAQVESVADNVALRMATPMRDHPYFYVEKAFFSALSANYLTATSRANSDVVSTLCPTDYVVPAMVGFLAEQYRHKQPWAVEFWDRIGQHAARQLDAKHTEFGPRLDIRPDRDRGFEDAAKRDDAYVGATEAATPAHEETRVAPERPPTIPPTLSQRKE